MTNTIQDLFLREQTQLIMRHKPFGILGLFLNVEANSDIENFGTDGKTLFINPNAIDKTGQLAGFGNNGEFLFHTLVHIVNKDLFNAVGDVIAHKNVMDTYEYIRRFESDLNFNKSKLSEVKDDHSLWKNATADLAEFWDEKIRLAYSLWGMTMPDANNMVYDSNVYTQSNIEKYLKNVYAGYDLKVDKAFTDNIVDKITNGVTLPNIADILKGDVASPSFDEADSLAILFGMLKQIKGVELEGLSKAEIQNLFRYIKDLPRLATIVLMKDSLKQSIDENAKRIATAKANGTFTSEIENRKYLTSILVMKDWIEWSKKYKEFIM